MKASGSSGDRKRSLYNAILNLDGVCDAASVREDHTENRYINRYKCSNAELETSIYSFVYPAALRTVKKDISKGKISSPVLKKIIVEELTLKDELKALDSVLEKNKKMKGRKVRKNNEHSAEKGESKSIAKGESTADGTPDVAYLLSETKRELEQFHQTLLKVGYTNRDLEDIGKRRHGASQKAILDTKGSVKHKLSTEKKKAANHTSTKRISPKANDRSDVKEHHVIQEVHLPKSSKTNEIGTAKTSNLTRTSGRPSVMKL